MDDSKCIVDYACESASDSDQSENFGEIRGPNYFHFRLEDEECDREILYDVPEVQERQLEFSPAVEDVSSSRWETDESDIELTGGTEPESGDGFEQNFEAGKSETITAPVNITDKETSENSAEVEREPFLSAPNLDQKQAENITDEESSENSAEVEREPVRSAPINLDQKLVETSENVPPELNQEVEQNDLESANDQSCLDSQANSGENFARRGKYACKTSDLPPTLCGLLGQVKVYWTKPNNMLRQSGPISETTVSKNMERVLCYLGFLKDDVPEELTAHAAFGSIEPMERYLDYLREVRQLSPSTMSLHLNALLYVVKYIHVSHAPLYNDVPLIRTMRNCSTALQKEGESVRLVTKEDLHAAEKWLEWEEVLAGLRNQQIKFELAVGLKKAREMATLVLLSMYCRIPPSRGLEIRTLRLVCENDTPKPSTNWKRDYKHQNIIYLLADGNIEIHLQAHKTAKSYGADHLNLEAHKELTRVIRDYVLHYRSQLVGEGAENFLLLNTQGGAFSASTFTSRLKSIFYELTGVQVSVNSLRTSFVTYCYDQTDCSEGLKDSLAASMRHSRKQAEQTYDRRTKCQRKRSALAYTEELAESVTDKDITEPTPSTSREDPLASKRFKAGDFVAVLEEGSSLLKPLVHIGQVQYYINSKQVELLWYKKRGLNCYSLELDSQEWIEEECDLAPVEMKHKKGKNANGQWKLSTCERTLHKQLTDEGVVD